MYHIDTIYFEAQYMYVVGVTPQRKREMLYFPINSSYERAEYDISSADLSLTRLVNYWKGC